MISMMIDIVLSATIVGIASGLWAKRNEYEADIEKLKVRCSELELQFQKIRRAL